MNVYSTFRDNLNDGERPSAYTYNSNYVDSSGLYVHTVCPGSSDPPEKIIDIFASENEVYIIY